MRTSIRHSANQLIPPPKGITENKYRMKDGETDDIIEVILYADKLSGSDTEAFTREIFEGMKMKDAMYKLWHLVRSEIRYKKDKSGHERIKSPAKTWKDRYGDCKSMSIFIGSVLQNLRIPYSYRFASYTQNGDVTHVYVIAHTKEKDFILDAVYDKFDREESYAYKKDYKGMTKIDFVHGLNKNQPKRFNIGATYRVTDVLAQPEDVARIDDSPKKVAPKRFFNYPVMTEGEFALQLLDRKLEIIQKFYGDPTGEVSAGRKMIMKALAGNVHNFSSFTGAVPDSLQSVASQIVQAKKKSAPAVRVKDPVAQSAIGELISKVDCAKKFRTRYYDPRDGIYKYRIPPGNEAAYKECIRIQSFRDVMNNHYDEAAYHMLYEFVRNPNQQTKVVANKTISQKKAIDDLSLITLLSRNNFRSWTEVGIMARNATKKQVGPLEPVAIIDRMKKLAGLKHSVSIGEPVSTTVVIIKVVGQLLIAALSIIGTHFLTKPEIAQAQIQGFGTENMSANPCDWWQSEEDCMEGAGGGQSPGFDVASVSPLILLGLGGFLLLNNK